MAYTKAALKAHTKYKREKDKRFDIGFTNILWNSLLSPSVEKSELTQSSFIRIAIVEKILNDHLYEPGEEQELKKLIDSLRTLKQEEEPE